MQTRGHVLNILNQFWKIFFKKQNNYIKTPNVKYGMGSRKSASGKVNHKTAFCLKYLGRMKTTSEFRILKMTFNKYQK